MPRFASLLILLAVLLGLGPAAAAPDPLTHHGALAASSGPALPLGRGMLSEIAAAQHRLNDTISAEFRNAHDTGSRLAILAILGLSFLYGVLHAVGPGHGKAVVAAYFVANRARWTSGITMGSLVSLVQGVSAILLVGALALILRWREFEVLNRTAVIECVSYALIALIGAVMLYRAVTGRGCAHDHGAHAQGAHDHGAHPDHVNGDCHGGRARLDARLILATGLTPCASAIIILLFALANGVLGLGIAAVAMLTIGMAATVSSIGVLSVLGRRLVLRLLEATGLESGRLAQGLAIAGALVITTLSSLMMIGAWLSL
jgi:ABC-type nickel/cobalt efflux system permease component RcnA